MEVDTEEGKHIVHEFGLYDPLSIDMRTACQNLLSQIDKQNLSSPIFTKGRYEILNSYIINDASYEVKDTNKVLDFISDLLLDPSLTLIIANLFRPILIDLVTRWLLLNNDNSMEPDYDVVSKVESVASAFSLLLPIKPQLLR